MIEVAGEAANGVIGADIYFPQVEPFASNPVNQRFVAKTQELYKYMPDKFMALGATALQVWAMAANELKTLDREAIAKLGKLTPSDPQLCAELQKLIGG